MVSKKCSQVRENQSKQRRSKQLQLFGTETVTTQNRLIMFLSLQPHLKFSLPYELSAK